ncbi:MAG: hypothetical protein VX527_10415 [Planctomycetota bacterium]|nr:hypothetical protein [Planctomycetota bacterium]
MRLAIATCNTLPEWEVDDAPLHRALEARGVDISHEIWTDPTVDWASYTACLIRTTWDYYDRLEQFLEWAQRVSVQTQLFNPMQTVRWNTCKSYLQDLEAAGLPVIPTEWFEPGDRPELKAVMSNRGWTRGFIKPQVGATASGTMRFETDAHNLQIAQDHLDTLLECQAALVQPYLEQVETLGEWSAIFIDGVWSHAVRKIPVPGDYRVQDDFGASDEPYEPAPSERALAMEVMHARQDHSNWTGEPRGQSLLYGRVDMLYSGETPLINEVELVEPSLFFRHEPDAALRLTEAILQRC